MLNHCEIMGRITAPLELKQTPGGKNVISFTVAVDRGVKNEAGESVTDFINVVAWEKTAEFIYKYFGKGRMICIEGQIQTRSWNDNEGKKRYTTEIRADKVHFTGERKENATEGENESDSGNLDGFMPVNNEDLPF